MDIVWIHFYPINALGGEGRPIPYLYRMPWDPFGEDAKDSIFVFPEVGCERLRISSPTSGRLTLRHSVLLLRLSEGG